MGRYFPSVQTGPGAQPASCTMGTGSFPGVKYSRGVLLTTHPLLVPWSWKSRAIPLPTLWVTTGPVTGTLYLYIQGVCNKEASWLSQRVVTRPRFGRGRNRGPFCGKPAVGPIRPFIQWVPEASLIHGALCAEGFAGASSMPLIGDNCRCIEISFLQNAMLLTSRNVYVAHSCREVRNGTGRILLYSLEARSCDGNQGSSRLVGKPSVFFPIGKVSLLCTIRLIQR